MNPDMNLEGTNFNIIKARDLIIYQESDFGYQILATVKEMIDGKPLVTDHIPLNATPEEVINSIDLYGVEGGMLTGRDKIMKVFDYGFEEWSKLNAEYLI